MTKYKILVEPDPILRQKCEPIGQVDDKLRTLMKDMLETMYKGAWHRFGRNTIRNFKKIGSDRYF